MELMMENTGDLEMVEQGEPASDSAYGSSPVDTDTEEGQTLSSSTLTLTYNEELMHKVTVLSVCLHLSVTNTKHYIALFLKLFF